jgi:hypothetical protein
MRTRSLALFSAAVLTITMASPALAGPPWISAEYRATRSTATHAVR